MCMNKCSVSDLCHLSSSRGVGRSVMIGGFTTPAAKVQDVDDYVCEMCVYIMDVWMCVYITNTYVSVIWV